MNLWNEHKILDLDDLGSGIGRRKNIKFVFFLKKIIKFNGGIKPHKLIILK
jgi:hypothetical protein